jgi:hypothetical protein
VSQLVIDDRGRPRRKISVWPFLVGGLALVLLLAIFLFLREEPRRLELDTPARANLPAQGAYAGTITDVATLVGPRDREGLVGREVALEGAQVLQVLSERAFLIGPSLTQKAIVVFDPQAAPAGAAPPPKVDAGDVVAVTGRLVALPRDQATLASLGLDELTPAERADLQFQVAATTVIETVERSGER